MLTRRLIANLIAFFLVSFALVAYGVVDLLGNPLRSPMTVSAVFPDASGLVQNFNVQLNGVDVGTVSNVELAPHGARVVMSIAPGTSIPRDVVASIDIANDLGQQVVELTPTRSGPAPALKQGAVIAVAKGSIPANVGQVVATATKLLAAIPPGDLNSLLGDLASALQGRGEDLRTITEASATFAQEFLNYQHQFETLLANAPPVLNAVSAVGPQLQAALINTASLVQVLANRKSDLTNLLEQGATSTGQLENLVSTQAPNLACLIHDLSDVTATIAQPTNLNNLSIGLADNQYFFGAINKVAVDGLAVPLTSSQTASQKIFLRTRLFIPPVTPAGMAYATVHTLPDIEPGAGCTNEFGQGVAAASQPNFTPAAGGQLVSAPSSLALIHGEGDSGVTPVSSQSSAFVAKRSDPMGILLPLGGLLVPTLLLAWAARPSRRRARRRA
jgi:phospholipid/cholesterol/gamma-HCH transport system substrate-binding protein